MSFDEQIVQKVVEAAARVRLEYVIIGNVAAILQDAPVLTQDIDLFVRHTPRNLAKIKAMADALGGILMQPHELSRMMTIETTDLKVDFVFDLSSRRRFESVRSRAKRMKFGTREALAASLEDVIAAKEAANRPKDVAVLPILKNTLRCKQKMENQKRR